jgi:hypothetical protein
MQILRDKCRKTRRTGILPVRWFGQTQVQRIYERASLQCIEQPDTGLVRRAGPPPAALLYLATRRFLQVVSLKQLQSKCSGAERNEWAVSSSLAERFQAATSLTQRFFGSS